jgi:hypothetical protein
MVNRTPHGAERHADAGRPASEAASDKAASNEIYQDTESGFYVFIGSRGRTHVFTPDGLNHTSFRTTRANRASRVGEGKWERIERDGLPDGLK